ncbi:MAG: protein hupE [Sphingomonas bacterium]|uniref:HupE/UreJ family protein n=1 Tax=Sphingomonas bacterium TaxID=1895847 RepID=UPI00262B97A9|nr:HupE/UreJ family protein [Sphingomonas bacterium]MDB5709427.1 protein hupE [Sphingomonas bacterium]
MRFAKMIVAVTLLTVAVPAFAHPGHDHPGLAGGLLHPLTGADHLLAMVAIGLFAAMRGGRATWAWPLGFVTAAALGFAAARFGFVAPLVEPAVLASVFVLGLLVVAAAPVSLGAGVALVALFGFAHGQAHAGEAGATAISAFAAGFLITSAALHVAGLGLYRVTGKAWTRLAGAATVAGGLALAFA